MNGLRSVGTRFAGGAGQIGGCSEDGGLIVCMDGAAAVIRRVRDNAELRRLPLSGIVTQLAVSNHGLWLAEVNGGELAQYLYVYMCADGCWTRYGGFRLRRHDPMLRWMETAPGYPPEQLQLAWPGLASAWCVPEQDGWVFRR